MFERKVSEADVQGILNSGHVIAEYPDDKPFPSYLVAGFVAERALHVVVAVDSKERKGVVITAYPPEPEQWDDLFEKRRTP